MKYGAFLMEYRALLIEYGALLIEYYKVVSKDDTFKVTCNDMRLF